MIRIINYNYYIIYIIILLLSIMVWSIYNYNDHLIDLVTVLRLVWCEDYNFIIIIILEIIS